MSADIIQNLCRNETGVVNTFSPLVQLFQLEHSVQREPFLYGPSLAIICRGAKIAKMDNRVLHFGSNHDLIVSGCVPLECAYSASKAQPVVGVLIRFETRLMHTVMSAIAEHNSSNTAATLEKVNLVDTLPKEPAIESALDRILDNLMDRTRAALFVSDAVKEIYYHLLQGPQAAILVETFQGGKLARLQIALEYVRNNYQKPIKVEQLAAMCHMSTTNFYRVFREQTGDSPLQLIKKTRLSAAKMLIESQQGTIGQIANKVGYESASHFGRDFRSQYGQSPRSFF